MWEGVTFEENIYFLTPFSLNKVLRCSDLFAGGPCLARA